MTMKSSLMLQCGRVAEDAESRLRQLQPRQVPTCFNVAASLRTRNPGGSCNEAARRNQASMWPRR